MSKICHIIVSLGLFLLIEMSRTQLGLSFFEVINQKIGYNIYFQIAMINILCFIEQSWNHNESVNDIILLCWLSMLLTFNFMTGFFLLLVLLSERKNGEFKFRESIHQIIKNKRIVALYILNITCILVLYLTLFSLIRG